MHLELHRDALLQRLDVADYADHLAAGVEGIQSVQRHLQGFAIEGAEAFVEKQRVDAGLVADQVRQRQRQGQADQEALAARQGLAVTGHVALPGIDHLQLQFATAAPGQLIAAMQALQLLVGQMN